ncbi:tape-measure protein [Streptomyces abikoensis]|uniref:tape-measure protein n=1 Tax=Streptomyces abikoensis TaxID=97398 RepID=UPI00371DBF11
MAAAAAAALPRNPLANSAGAFRNFGSALGQAARSVRTVQNGVRNAARAADRIRTSTGQAGKEARQFGTGAGAAGRSALAVGRQAGTAHAGLLKTKSGGQQSARLLKNINRQATASGRSIARTGKSAGILGKFTGILGGKLKIAGGIMTAVNLVMKTNPFVLVLSLLAPFATELIDFALNSELGQQIMETVFGLVEAYFTTALTVIVPVITGYLAVIKGVWKTLESVVKPVVTWVTKDIPGGFRKVNSAMEKALHGMGDFLRTGFQMVIGVVKGPLNGLIAFANWVIDGLNSLSFNFLGKHFGVNLSKIPMLAEGGVVSPRDGGVPVILAEAGEAEAVLPMSKLDQLLARTAEAARRTAPARAGARIGTYHEPEGRGAHAIASDLLFLAAAHA